MAQGRWPRMQPMTALTPPISEGSLSPKRAMYMVSPMKRAKAGNEIQK